LIATATRNGRHLLLVVMGSPSIFNEAASLLDYGFARPAP
jgi:D-alanyl-D-alanine carboxypeptidase